MRVAICLSGQSRFVEECFPSIFKNLIEPNCADVFLHTWECTSESEMNPYKFGGSGGWKNQRIKSGSHNLSIDLYKPVLYQIERPIDFKIPDIDMRRTFDKYMQGCYEEAKEAKMSVEQYSQRIISNNLSMWYGIMSSNLLATKYAMENGFKYDVIVRCRFDLILKTGIRFDKIPESTVYACEMGKPDGHVADWLNFGSQASMNILASTFFSFNKIYLDIESIQLNPFCNEQALATTLSRHNVQVVNLPILVDIPRL